MREILFRGKGTHGFARGKWIYGNYAKDFWGEQHKGFGIHPKEGGYSEVDPETVGQYTGLTANGKKIFEGDIIVMKIKGYDTICKVAWADNVAQFQLWQRNTIPNTPTALNLGNYDCEIIGNIHDNPELLNPSLKPEYRDGDPDAPICPNCRTPLREMEDCDCGQKIDWSEEE